MLQTIVRSLMFGFMVGCVAATGLVFDDKKSHRAGSVFEQDVDHEGCRSASSPPQQEEGWPKAGVVWSSDSCNIVNEAATFHAARALQVRNQIGGEE